MATVPWHVVVPSTALVCPPDRRAWGAEAASLRLREVVLPLGQLELLGQLHAIPRRAGIVLAGRRLASLLHLGGGAKLASRCTLHVEARVWQFKPSGHSESKSLRRQGCIMIRKGHLWKGRLGQPRSPQTRKPHVPTCKDWNDQHTSRPKVGSPRHHQVKHTAQPSSAQNPILRTPQKPDMEGQAPSRATGPITLLENAGALNLFGGN